MRGLVWLIPAFIIGFVLGGVPARRELAAAQEELSQAQRDLATAQKAVGHRAPLPIPLPALNDALTPVDRPPNDAPDDTSAEEDPGGATLAVPSEESSPSPPRNTAAELEEGFQAAVDAQRVRASQSRAALIEQADLSDEDIAEFEQIVSDMNDQLAQVAPDLIDLALSADQGDPNIRDTLGVAHDVTGILYDGQAALEDLVGDQNLKGVDDASKQVWNYVDLDAFGPALEAAAAAQGQAPPAAGSR